MSHRRQTDRKWPRQLRRDCMSCKGWGGGVDLLKGRGAISWGFTLPTIAPHVLPQVAQGSSP